MQVGLLPTKINDYTRSMFPMKYFEYLAAGLPVVGTPLAFAEKCTDGIEVASTVQDWVSAIERLLGTGRFGQAEVRKMIGGNNWNKRTKKMLENLKNKFIFQQER
jgi:glycosyltransferase involved in cell wall biosynthesis